MEWTFRPLDYFFWTIFWTVFLDMFLDLFFYPIFLWIFLWGGGGREHTICTQGVVGCSQSVLREGWEVDCYYFGRGGRRTISRSRCYWLMEYLLDHTTFFSGFSTDYFNVKIFELGWYAGLGFCHTNAKQYRNTRLQLLLKIWPILVFDPFPFVWIVYHY